MADTRKRYSVRDPYVKFEAGSTGKVTGTLQCWRKKTNGDYETIELFFESLSLHQLGCFGRAACGAESQAKLKLLDVYDDAYRRIITPGSK